MNKTSNPFHDDPIAEADGPAENQPTSPLLDHLADEPLARSRETAEGGVNFKAAMSELGHLSVFDIIREPKPQFVRSVARLWEGDAEKAYDNAMCYALQIARSFRERQVSSGIKPPPEQINGIRSLVDVGPSYPNLFTENWDKFCKVGAIAAIDSPAAYLTELYRFAKKNVEAVGSGGKKIPLDTRRPDLPQLLIDQQSTFKPIPMLQLANEVVTSNIQKYLDATGQKNQSIYSLLANKRHPFLFPYAYPHHQIMLGLSGKQPRLGEISYRASAALPLAPGARYGTISSTAFDAQCLLTGLSPAQQMLLTEPSLFTTFYLTRTDLAKTQSTSWRSPGSTTYYPWTNIEQHGYIVPDQDQASAPGANVQLTSYYGNPTAVSVTFNRGLRSQTTLTLRLYSVEDGYGHARAVNYSGGSGGYTKCLCMWYDRADNQQNDLPSDQHYQATFYILAKTHNNVADWGGASFLKRSFTLVLDTESESPDDLALSEQQRLFFKASYGTTVLTAMSNPLLNLSLFMDKTGLTSDQVDALLARGKYFPVLSPNCLQFNNCRDAAKGGGIAFPFSSHYGATYINGVGAFEPGMKAGTHGMWRFDNSLGLCLSKEQGKNVWYLSNTSLNRFDRMQRMIRLQRWMEIPFAQLDTLIVASIRAEGQDNLEMDLNRNTLRTLGVFRYLSRRYRITAEEFAAFLYYLSPYASGGDAPLFDRVFNAPSFFDKPFTLDRGPFSSDVNDAASQTTIQQLCAGLGLQPAAGSYGRLAAQTKQVVGPLIRSLPVVSSLYRQARIAQMFGLAPEEAQDLLHILGGTRYQIIVAGGVPHAVSKIELTSYDLSESHDEEGYEDEGRNRSNKGDEGQWNHDNLQDQLGDLKFLLTDNTLDVAWEHSIAAEGDISISFKDTLLGKIFSTITAARSNTDPYLKIHHGSASASGLQGFFWGVNEKFDRFSVYAGLPDQDEKLIIDSVIPNTNPGEFDLSHSQVLRDAAYFNSPAYIRISAHSDTGETQRSARIESSGNSFTATVRYRLFTLFNEDVVAQGPYLDALKGDETMQCQIPLAGFSHFSISYGIELTQWQDGSLQGVLGYVRKRANMQVELTRFRTEEPASGDILDILMELDWAVSWLKTSKQTVATLKRQLGLDQPATSDSDGLQKLLELLVQELRTTLVTEQKLQLLSLPLHQTGQGGEQTPIVWRAVLKELLDEHGLICSLPQMLQDDADEQLAKHVAEALAALKLHQDPEQDDKIKAGLAQSLTEFLVVTRHQQTSLIDSLLYRQTGLPQDRAEMVVAWAGSSVHDLLAQTLTTSPQLLALWQRVFRHAEVARQARLSAAALRTFTAQPAWLGTPSGNSALSLASLYLLQRYADWADLLGKSEHDVLGYFALANSAATPTLQTAHADRCASDLASLLGWSTDAVKSATARLPDGVAKSMAQVDWLLRLQALTQQTGLSTSTLLAACNLTTASTEQAWQAVGDAVMAASRRSYAAANATVN